MDQLNLERLGVPTVTIATTDFVSLLKIVALSEGKPDPRFAVVPHPMGMIPLADINKKAENAFPEILKATTAQLTAARLPAGKAAYPAERFQFSGSVKDLNRLFFDKGWSTGLPIIPPTPEAVAEMLKGTTRRPDEVLGQVAPRMGTLTVELVAAHAVMAGCKPEYMPVLIAALEAFLAPEANWRGALATTATTQFMVVANGPVVKQIGLAYEQGAAGKGQYANATIGYAINLIAYTVGESRPPGDQSTLASPGDFVCWVFGENEPRLPPGWEPLHVQRGFKASDSVVTVMCFYPPLDNADHWSMTLEQHVRWWSEVINPVQNIGGPCSPRSLELNPVIALGPEHAEFIASRGWTRAQFQ
ncbi:MAG: UGSC family (seleno)protein, partial [Chloroflexota bacterium]